MKNTILFLILLITITLLAFMFNNNQITQISNEQNSQKSWYYPSWIKNAKYNEPIKVIDIENSFGNISKNTKIITLKDIIKLQGYMNYKTVMAYVELKEVLKKLFPKGIVDRTDLLIISRNQSCWVDTASFITGARINFSTLSINNYIGKSYLIQRVSTGKAYHVTLKYGVYPKELQLLEAKIQKLKIDNIEVDNADLKKLEQMSKELIEKLLNSPSEEILYIKELSNFKYRFHFKAAKLPE